MRVWPDRGPCVIPRQPPQDAMHRFTLAQATLAALPSGALFWPDEALLCVSDLHFGKAERMARRGGALLPPYETRDTLSRLDADLETTRARSVICLGDSFDDLAASDAIPEDERLWLLRLMAGREWIWAEGNHDPGPTRLGGSHRAEILRGGLAFRHIASENTPEISGHYHPKARLGGKSRPCFLIDQRRVILPAYGTFTGGLYCDSAPLGSLMQPGALALLTGSRLLAIPMPQNAAPRPA